MVRGPAIPLAPFAARPPGPPRPQCQPTSTKSQAHTVKRIQMRMFRTWPSAPSMSIFTKSKAGMPALRATSCRGTHIQEGWAGSERAAATVTSRQNAARLRGAMHGRSAVHAALRRRPPCRPLVRQHRRECPFEFVHMQGALCTDAPQQSRRACQAAPPRPPGTPAKAEVARLVGWSAEGCGEPWGPG